jgi:hypothetical protein
MKKLLIGMVLVTSAFAQINASDIAPEQSNAGAPAAGNIPNPPPPPALTQAQQARQRLAQVPGADSSVAQSRLRSPSPRRGTAESANGNSANGSGQTNATQSAPIVAGSVPTPSTPVANPNSSTSSNPGCPANGSSDSSWCTGTKVAVGAAVVAVAVGGYKYWSSRKNAEASEAA